MISSSELRIGNKLRVIVGCEESQEVCKAFRARGHEAYSCDLLPCSGGHPEWHLQGDVLEVIKGGWFKTQSGDFINIRKWDLGIFHPPCTYLSKAGACRLYPKAGEMNMLRYDFGIMAKEFFLKLLNTPEIDQVCVENPVSLKAFNMPLFTQEVEPYWFGHPVSKRTRLWLRNLPLLTPTNMVEKKGTYLPSSTSKNAYSGKNDTLTRDPHIASKTFPGIARAMASQWSEDLTLTGLELEFKTP
jgi:hypothetical protein